MRLPIIVCLVLAGFAGAVTAAVVEITSGKTQGMWITGGKNLSAAIYVDDRVGSGILELRDSDQTYPRMAIFTSQGRPRIQMLEEGELVTLDLLDVAKFMKTQKSGIPDATFSYQNHTPVLTISKDGEFRTINLWELAGEKADR